MMSTEYQQRWGLLRINNVVKGAMVVLVVALVVVVVATRCTNKKRVQYAEDMTVCRSMFVTCTPIKKGTLDAIPPKKNKWHRRGID